MWGAGRRWRESGRWRNADTRVRYRCVRAKRNCTTHNHITRVSRSPAKQRSQAAWLYRVREMPEEAFFSCLGTAVGPQGRRSMA